MKKFDGSAVKKPGDLHGLDSQAEHLHFQF
jgi:hypothetical protein